jgi:hypothetical protein
MSYVFLFLLYLGKIFQQMNFELGMISQKLLAGTKKKNSQIFNEDFYLPLYLPLWAVATLVLHITLTLTSWRVSLGPRFKSPPGGIQGISVMKMNGKEFYIPNKFPIEESQN